MSHDDSPRTYQESPHQANLSRRDVGKRLGLLGATLLLDGCESLSPLTFPTFGKRSDFDPALLTPDQFSAQVGTVEVARANVGGGIEPMADFMRRFLFHSPRLHKASRSGGLIGSVFYNPNPAAIASAVALQMVPGKGEAKFLHNDLGVMAATQYVQDGAKSFVAIFPNSASFIGDAIHKDRAIIQLVLTGALPSAKIVCTNQDLESLIGRQLTFASQIVHGIRCGASLPSIRSTGIWTTEQTARIPEGTVSLALAGILIHLEIAGQEVKLLTPAAPNVRPTGWQDVSDAYRNFAVGQLIETEQALAQYVPRNAFEQSVASATLAEYHPYLTDLKKRLDWGHTCVQVYTVQKQEGRADLLAQSVFIHKEGARTRL